MPRTRQEMLDDGMRGLERHDNAVRETLGLLDGWLITLSSAALAGPFVFSANTHLETRAQWWLLALAYASLALTIAAIFIRRLIQLSRGGHLGKVLLTAIADARASADAQHVSSPEVVATVNEHHSKATRLARIELRLQRLSVGLFMLGMALLGILALIRALPRGGTG